MTHEERIRAIQDEFEQETGERPSRAVAEVLLDQRADAEFHRREGGAYDPVPEEETEAEPQSDPEADYDENSGWEEEQRHPSW